MKIVFKNELQSYIADLMWTAPNFETAQNIAKQFGPDGYVVYNMLIATMLDEVQDVSIAAEVLEHIKKGDL